MKIKLNIFQLVTIGLFFGMSFHVTAQQTTFHVTEDGDPIFNNFKTGYDPGIVLTDSDGIVVPDSGAILQLAPISGDTTFSPLQPWKMDGILWQYSNARYSPDDPGYIRHAADVDDITAVMGDTLYLITDQGDNKVVIFRPNSPLLSPAWQFDPKNASYSFPTDAQLYQENIAGTPTKFVLITWKGTNVVTKVNYNSGRVVWEYGHPSTPSVADGYLNSPSDAEKIEGEDEILIADTGNKRVIIVDETTNLPIWSYSGPDAAFSPVDIQYIHDETLGEQILITDQTANRVLLIDRATQLTSWSFGFNEAGSDSTHLKTPSDADWNPSTRRVVIADKGNNRIIEVSPEDLTYFYVWPNEVNSVDDVDALATGGFFVCQKEVQNGEDFWLPTIIEFSNKPIERYSDIFSLNKDVDFQTLTWQAHDITPDTQVQFQFSSSSSYSSAGLLWMGPDGTPNTYYTTVDSTLFAGHKIHRFFQVKAILRTTDPRITPIVDNVRVSYDYYNISQRQQVYSHLAGPYTIGATRGAPVVVYWDSLYLAWKPSEEERSFLSNLAFIASLTNADAPDRTLLNLGPLAVTFEPTRISLAGFDELLGVQRIGLVITMISYNTALTPRLDKWRVTWRETEIGPPSVFFVDAAGNPKEFYTAATYIPAATDSIFADLTYVQLTNLQEIESSLQIEVVSNRSLDVENVTVERDVERIGYSTPAGIPTIIVELPTEVTINNDTLEVYDRDTLSARFQSVLRPTEILTDSILVVQGMIGQLFALNSATDSLNISASQLNQRIFARVTHERDRSLDLVAQDTIMVSVINPATGDSESLTLFEDEGQTGLYDSGVFTSQNGILLREALNYTPDDGILYVRPNDVIQVVYHDNFKKPQYPTRQFVEIPSGPFGPLSAQALLCQVAPNPYYSSSGIAFRMRLGSSLGAVTVQKLEVFNLGGEKVAEFIGSDIVFEWGGNEIPMNQYGNLNNWWNLQSDSDHPVSSGTYWVKVHAEVANAATSVVDKLTTLTKFVVIR